MTETSLSQVALLFTSTEWKCMCEACRMRDLGISVQEGQGFAWQWGSTVEVNVELEE